VHPALSKRALALRVVGFVIAVALGAVGVWLIVTSGSQKSMRLGVLAGLWGLLLGTFTMFGSRRGHEVVLPAQPEPPQPASTELSRADEAAAQRAYEARLEHMLRREIQSSVAREVGELRNALAALRNELLDKVGGQIALERIETTRIIGSDLEALQREVRQLRERRDALDQQIKAEAPSPRPLDVGPPRTDERNRPLARPLTVSTEIVDAEVLEDDAAEGYRGRRRRDEDGDSEVRTRRGRHSPEGEELLARLLSRDPS
jgi:hypothetical protein